MTHWMVLFVEEDLAATIEEILYHKKKVEKCISNPFSQVDDWVYMIRNNPHHAAFKLEDGLQAKITFWCKFNESYGDPHEYPVVIDEERMVVVIE